MNYPWGMANSFSNLGILTIQKGDWPQALIYLEKALSLRQEIGDLHNEAFTHLNLGQLRLSMGDFAEANNDLQAGLVILRQLDDNFGIAGANVLMAQIALAERKFPQAEQFAAEAMELADKIGGQKMRIEARWVTALARAEQEDLSNGARFIDEALRLAKEAGSLDAEADCLRIRA